MNDTDSTHGSQAIPVAEEQLLPMGAVTRRTGIGEHTLRAWERRFGFPKPLRLPSGHRRYTVGQVQQLMMINEALRCGHRAGDVVPLPRERLEALLEECEQALETEESSRAWLQEVFEAARAFDRTAVQKTLYQGAVKLGLHRFLRERVGPLMTEVGEAWARGDLGVRHEHFISEILEEVLRDLRRPLEATAEGQAVVLASLPSEQHTLGIHIAALAVAAAGRHILILGPQTPVEEIAAAATSVRASAVGISISPYAATDPTLSEVMSLRESLPSGINLWLGGSGAIELSDLPADVEVLDSLDALERALRRLVD
ncbi:MAG: MerR family transcriptional regulator [Acidobacteria bacterium]|nr:MerR family transcriptional regulator [Acidobacteriota bacterium]